MAGPLTMSTPFAVLVINSLKTPVPVRELHSPDRLYLTANQILFVEPVGPDSKVADLIQQSKSGR
jgi:hypothetical protein